VFGDEWAEAQAEEEGRPSGEAFEFEPSSWPEKAAAKGLRRGHEVAR